MVLQFGFQLVMARLYGATDDMDAYSAALAVPLVVTTILVGSLHYAFTPVYIQRRDQLGAEAGWRTASQLGLGIALGAALLSAAGAWFAGPLVRLLQPGFSPELALRATGLFQVLIWQTWTIGVVAFLQMLYYCERRYLTAALPPLLGTIFTIGWTLLLAPRHGIQAAAVGTVVGGVLVAACQAPLFVRHFQLGPALDPGVLRILYGAWPLLLGALYYKLDPLVDRYLASGFETGSIARLGYADRLMAAILSLSTSGVANVVFPLLSARAAAGDHAGLRSTVGDMLRFQTFILVPATLGLAVFAHPVIVDLYQRGRFTAYDSQVVAAILVLLLGVFVGGSLGEILSRVYFALGETRVPALICGVGFTLGVIVKVAMGQRWGVTGLAASTSFYFLWNAAVFYLLLSRRLGGLAPVGLVGDVFRALAASGGAVAAAALVAWQPFPAATFVAALLGGAVYVLIQAALGDPLARKVLQRR